ncbi:unnamed protein product [Blepharisma stoltei]|uniref:Uncharacterized protein n=1 Tax=Blepharisma stoltei TaxID=1481888 RepID=A0AAU9J2K6_9CILI|nr:unnamed protein product [Blepharisma stoltei]
MSSKFFSNFWLKISIKFWILFISVSISSIFSNPYIFWISSFFSSSEHKNSSLILISLFKSFFSFSMSCNSGLNSLFIIFSVSSTLSLNFIQIFLS